MKILLTGATGFMGRHLLPRLFGAGHDVVILARNPADAAGWEPPVRALPWPRADSPPPPEALAGIDAVIHLAGEPLAAGRWTRRRKRLILESRVDGTRQLLGAFKNQGIPLPVVVCASAVGYYGSRGDTELTESDSPGTDFLAGVCRQWEGAVIGNLPAGTRPVMLRFGMVLGHGGGALPRLVPIYRAGLGGPLGDGRQWVSWIHIEDAVSLIVTALESSGWQGAVNAVSPNPVRNGEFNRALAKVLRRPAFMRVPAPVLKLGLGGMASVLLGSQRALPQKVLAGGFSFRFPSMQDALADLLAGGKPATVPKGG